MKYAALVVVAGLALSSCDARGRRAAEVRAIRPSEVVNFGELFAQNCSGCHGKDGQGALTVGIGRPIYLAIADAATIRRTIEQAGSFTAVPGLGGVLIRLGPATIAPSWSSRPAFRCDPPISIARVRTPCLRGGSELMSISGAS